MDGLLSKVRSKHNRKRRAKQNFQQMQQTLALTTARSSQSVLPTSSNPKLNRNLTGGFIALASGSGSSMDNIRDNINIHKSGSDHLLREPLMGKE